MGRGGGWFSRVSHILPMKISTRFKISKPEDVIRPIVRGSGGKNISSTLQGMAYKFKSLKRFSNLAEYNTNIVDRIPSKIKYWSGWEKGVLWYDKLKIPLTNSYPFDRTGSIITWGKMGENIDTYYYFHDYWVMVRNRLVSGIFNRTSCRGRVQECVRKKIWGIRFQNCKK